MTNDNGSDHSDSGSGEIDTGRPITLLRELEVPPSSGFLGRVRNRIQRRQFAADVSGLVWFGPILVLLELFSGLFSALGSNHPGPDRPPRPSSSKET